MLTHPSKTLATLAVLATLAGLSMAATARADEAQVRVESGMVRGQLAATGVVFKAIPYAAPPTGALRWAPPRPPARWKGVRPADRFGFACPQIPFGGFNEPTSEDCLALNLWAPRKAHGAPVMVWIHGGGHRFGSGSSPLYDGSAFARDGVVLVTFNYRLGGLAYFAHPALTRAAGPREALGNYGLMDQMAALAWVKRNIAAFGGDPGNVTVFGQSSSAIDVQALMAIPAASGLFRKAIVESGGSWITPVSLHEREGDGVKLAEQAGLTGNAATAARLRALPASAFLDPTFAFDFEPFVDGRLVTRTSTQAFAQGRAAAKPMIVGFNSYEGAIAPGFGGLGDLPRRLSGLYHNGGRGEADLRALYGDRFFGAPSRWVAARAGRRAPTWLYRFSYVPSQYRGQLPGAPHGSEVTFVFDSWDKLGGGSPSAPAAGGTGPTAEDRAMTARLHACWVAFARAGKPDCAGTPAWPAYSARTDQLMDFDVQPVVRDGVRKVQFDALEQAVITGLLAAAR